MAASLIYKRQPYTSLCIENYPVNNSQICQNAKVFYSSESKRMGNYPVNISQICQNAKVFYGSEPKCIENYPVNNSQICIYLWS